MNRPNFILLVGEDAGRAAGCYGDRDARTPNLDRLATRGCRFDNAFSTAPVCAPSRSTLITGQYSWSIGSHHMRSKLLRPPRLFTEELRDAGYYVNWENKTDFNFEPPRGFADDCAPWLDNLRRDALPAGDRPFFLYHNFGITHESTMWPEPWEGGGSVRDRLRLRDSLTPGQRTDASKVRVPAYLPDMPEVRQNIARFYEALAIMDGQVGAVVDALDASPYANNTIVIYLTDHGRGLPREKRWCYGAGIHLSLLVRAPKLLAPGSARADLVSWVDIAPTVLVLAGISVPDQYHGQVFLGEKRVSERPIAFAGRDRMDETFDRVRVARDARWHYIRNYFPQLPYCQRVRYMEHMETTEAVRELHAQGRLNADQRHWMSEAKPVEELYDAQADPDMVHNLADDPASAGVLIRLRRAWEEMEARHGDLGVVPERELIQRGLVANVLDSEYTARIEPLPERHRVGVDRSVLEWPGDP